MQTGEYPTLENLIDAEKHNGQAGSIHSVQTLADTEPAFNEGGIRWTIFQHKQDLIEYGAIFYSGKKLLIDRQKYIEYLKSENK